MSLNKHKASKHVNHRQQKGVALISTLLVFSLVVILVSMQSKQLSSAIHTTKSNTDYAQAWQYLLASEMHSRYVLIQDRKHEGESNSPHSDHYGEAWYQPVFPLEIPNTEINVIVEDLQGRFNINTLIGQDGKPSPQGIKQFKRLLSFLELPEALANNISDWLDNDSQSQHHDTEDDYYARLSPPYQSAGKKIHDTGDIYAIKDVSRLFAKELLPYISAVPTSVSININTARNAVLASLADNIQVERIIERRQSLEYGFESLSQFDLDASTAGIEFNGVNMSVDSQYFLISTQVKIHDTVITCETTVYRDNNMKKTYILSRKIIPYKNFDKQYG